MTIHTYLHISPSPFDRSRIARRAAFTFYLAVPTMFGATVYDLYKEWHGLTAADTTNIAIGFVVSFVVAYGVVKTFIAFIGKYGLKPFGWYRIATGAALLGWLFLK
jgi:undecaprenyl-diphosphatase